MAHKKRLMLANPNKMYHAPDGTVVDGNAIVAFNTPLHPDVQLKLAKGVLVETDEPARGNSYQRQPGGQASPPPRWLNNRPPHQKIHPPPNTGLGAPFGGLIVPSSPVPTEKDIPASLKKEIADLRERLKKLEGGQGDVAGLQGQIDNLATQVETLTSQAGVTFVGGGDGQLAYLRQMLSEADEALRTAKSQKAKIDAQERIDDITQQIEALTGPDSGDGA